MTAENAALIEQAARAVSDAEALLVCAGAGIGVDSGLPDFRGDEGFWKAYPPLRNLGISFYEMACPDWFERDPTLAWGFYGHRLNLYRATMPHRGFEILAAWGQAMPHPSFVFTSNVDGHFQRAGFDADQVLECHGSINHLQCVRPCDHDIWPAQDTDVIVDEDRFRAAEPLPRCRNCGGLARPNVLMFGDWSWISGRSHEQEARFQRWATSLGSKRLVIVELGAGTAVPTVRLTAERAARHWNGTLVRINLREPQCPPDGIGIAAGALETLEAIEARLGAPA